VVDKSTQLRSDDDGITIVEVMVAMMIFAIIFLGVAQSVVTTMRMTADTVSREVAANLAAAEIDAVRQLDDPFTVEDATHSTVIDGVEYVVDRATGWVSSTGTIDGCGAGTGTLQFKRVNVTVRWTGQMLKASSARADTVLAPETRLNDPSFGSILISVLAADGTGASGVGVTVTAASGGAALAAQPVPTDGDGCTYAFMVAPGTYNVTVGRTGYIDAAQSTAPTASVAVAAGSAVSASFQYDAAATYAVSYAEDAPPARHLPADLGVTFFSTYGVHAVTGTPVTVPLHPFPSGYSAIAGRYVAPSQAGAGCISADPASWQAGTVNGKTLAAGERIAAVAADPGGTKDLDIPMGILEVEAGAASMRVTSAAAPATTGDPGCSTAVSHTYSSLPGSGKVSLAVPYGSWTLEEQVSGSWVTVPPSRYTVPTNAAGEIRTGNVVTVDPRELAP
jgi:type II secretory pathway pseudopilin PulG